ncbi:MAG: hypothetical protein R3D51_06960 [Hyphomicrobiaceae bacterium]|jgi:hypothetical protein
MYKSILAATALALAASAVPAAAYDNGSRHSNSSSSYSKGYSNGYAKGYDRGEYRGERFEHNRYGYGHHHHHRRPWWWQRYYGSNRY